MRFSFESIRKLKTSFKVVLNKAKISNKHKHEVHNSVSRISFASTFLSEFIVFHRGHKHASSNAAGDIVR